VQQQQHMQQQQRRGKRAPLRSLAVLAARAAEDHDQLWVGAFF